MKEARKLKSEHESSSMASDKSTIERVKDTHTSELVIGICSQIGAKKNLIVEKLEKELGKYNYKFIKLKLSEYILKDNTVEVEKQKGKKTDGFYDYVYKIEKGNALRKKYGRDYLANMAVSQIANDKKRKFNIEDESDFGNISSQRICYIIDSIKNQEELNVLRDIYGELFYLISVFTPKKERIKSISIPNITKNEAVEIIDIDQYEESKLNGQQVRDVFINADFFIKVDKTSETKIPKKIERFADLIFENELVTPSIEERAMFEAKSASVNSACLSRQVGASILSCEEELLSVGWNDVPKFGGNLYTSDSRIDNRCFLNGNICYNDKNKETLREVIKKEFKSKLEKTNFDNKEKIVNLLEKVLLDSSIKNLIEFSRSVHAEMHAILNAGQLNGSKIKNGTLFCTTYPCHNCVRHIIAAGITKVYFIEPYIKSKGIDLHSDSITDDSNIESEDGKGEKVQILMFEGVSPIRYLSFFSKFRSRKNKNTGVSKCNKRDKTTLNPINSISLKDLFYRELQASIRIKEKKQHINESQQQQKSN